MVEHNWFSYWDNPYDNATLDHGWTWLTMVDFHIHMVWPWLNMVGYDWRWFTMINIINLMDWYYKPKGLMLKPQGNNIKPKGLIL